MTLALRCPQCKRFTEGPCTQPECQPRHELAPHCDDPGCCMGVIIGRCTVCGATGVGHYEPCPGDQSK